MGSQIQKLLTRLEQRIYKFIKDDGVLDAADHDTKVYKATLLLHLANEIQQNNSVKCAFMENAIQHLTDIVNLIEMGDPSFESEQQIRSLLHNIRSGIKGLLLSLELNELSSDEDIPEYVNEAFEPCIDLDTGECHYSTDLEFYSNVLWSFKVNRLDYQRSASYSRAIDCLTKDMQNCSLQLKNDFQVDLGDGMKGIANPIIAMQAELQAMHTATMRYFEPSHIANTLEIARVAQAFYQKQNVETDLSAGSLIVAACEALRSLHLMKDNLEQHEAKLSWQTTDLSLQRRPSTKNLGNLFIRNVGCYGYREIGKKSKANILDDFERVAEYSGEYRLKEVIANYGANPNQITLQMLKLPDTSNGNSLLRKLKQNLFLIFCAEIFRYFPVEATECPSAKKIPFAVALSMGLELLCADEIELNDLFDHDAELGLPTGIKILDNCRAVSQKLSHLIERYQLYLQEAYSSVERFKQMFPHGMVVSEDSQHVDRLQTYFGRHLKRNL